MAISILHTQPLGTNYSDSFWDDQCKGVDIVINKSRQSKESCEAIKRLYKSRAQLEEEYGEKLLKLLQTSDIGQLEEGTFAETLSQISSALETTARAHIDLAQQLKDHLELPLDGFIKEQRDLRKLQQQQIENSRQLKNLHETDVARAREYYASERTKLSVMEAQFASEQEDESSINFEKEIEEQKRMVVVADQVFKRSTDSFNRINDKWVTDWKKASSVFQDMEIKRINYLRNTLWTYSNMMTNTFNVDEDCCDRIRTALEITDVEKDILGFVQRYGTGTKIPVPVFHEPLYTSLSTSQISLPAPTPKTSLDSQIRNMNKSDSLLRSSSQPPVTILTNPDEELKSVDRQLLQLEVIGTPKTNLAAESNTLRSSEQPSPPQSPATKEKEPMSGVTATTTSHGAVSTAMKEVEFMLNQPNGSHSESNKQQHHHQESIDLNDPTLKESQQQQQQHRFESPAEIDSAPIVDTPGVLSAQSAQSAQNDRSNDLVKFKPLPNPDFENAKSTDNNINIPPTENKGKKEQFPEILLSDERQYAPATLPKDLQLDHSQELRNGAGSDNNSSNNNNKGNSDKAKDQDEDEDDEDEDEQLRYQSKLPRSTPKDEKWVISSIRRPQQLPVRAMNAQMFDGNNSVNRTSLSPPIVSQIEGEKHEEEKTPPTRLPKPHRPAVPLTIDIPNSINKAPSHPNIHAITQQVALEENRRHSHPSPIQQQPMESIYHAAHQTTDRNMIRNYINQTNSNAMNTEIRPAPWLDENGNMLSEEHYPQPNNMPNHHGGNNNNNYYGGYPTQQQQQQQQQQQFVGPRGSSLKMNPQQLQQLHQDLYHNEEDTSKKRLSSAPLPAVTKLQNEKHKDSKSSGRFSLPFFSNKKDKKKEKESKEVAAAASVTTTSAPTSFYGNTNGYRPQQQDPYQRSQSQVIYQLPQQIHSPPLLQQSQPQLPQEIIEPTHNTENQSHPTENRKYIGYARALWTFEANIKEEMSFQAGDTIGVIRKQTDGWWEAELTKQGVVHHGLVPGNYMDAIQS